VSGYCLGVLVLELMHVCLDIADEDIGLFLVLIVLHVVARKGNAEPLGRKVDVC